MASNKSKPASDTLGAARRFLIADVSAAALTCTASRAKTPSVSAVVVKAINGCFASGVRFPGLVVPRAAAIALYRPLLYQIDALHRSGSAWNSLRAGARRGGARQAEFNRACRTVAAASSLKRRFETVQSVDTMG